MRKFAKILPFVPIVTGAAGFFLRQKELGTVFTEGSSLAARMTPVSVALGGLCAVCFALFIVLAVLSTRRSDIGGSYDAAFKPDLLSVALLLMSAGALIAVNLLNIMENMPLQTVETVFGIAAIVTGLCLIVMTYSAFKGLAGSELYLCSVIPPVFCCFWMVLVYVENMANPVLLDFAYRIIALAALAISFYFDAGFVYRRKKPAAAVMMQLFAVHMAIVTLADGGGMFIVAAIGCLAVNRVFACRSLLSNLEPKQVM